MRILIDAIFHLFVTAHARHDAIRAAVFQEMGRLGAGFALVGIVTLKTIGFLIVEDFMVAESLVNLILLVAMAIHAKLWDAINKHVRERSVWIMALLTRRHFQFFFGEADVISRNVGLF